MSAYTAWQPPTDTDRLAPDVDANTTRCAYELSGDDVTLSLRFPRELLSLLVGVADQAAESYSKGGDTDEDLLFADLVLRPLANLIARAEQA